MKTLSLKLPDEVDLKLRSAARRSQTTRSEVVRRALLEYLSRDDEALPGSFLELAQDLVGIHDGPGDLSVNKQYFADFGR